MTLRLLLLESQLLEMSVPWPSHCLRLVRVRRPASIEERSLERSSSHRNSMTAGASMALNGLTMQSKHSCGARQLMKGSSCTSCEGKLAPVPTCILLHTGLPCLDISCGGVVISSVSGVL